MHVERAMDQLKAIIFLIDQFFHPSETQLTKYFLDVLFWLTFLLPPLWKWCLTVKKTHIKVKKKRLHIKATLLFMVTVLSSFAWQVAPMHVFARGTWFFSSWTSTLCQLYLWSVRINNYSNLINPILLHFWNAVTRVNLVLQCSTQQYFVCGHTRSCPSHYWLVNHPPQSLKQSTL